MKLFFTIISTLLSVGLVSAQTLNTIRGNVVNPKGTPVMGFNAAVMNRQDSTTVAWKYFDKDGFEITYDATKHPNVMLYIAAYGYNDKFIIIDPEAYNLGEISLTELSYAIDGVVVREHAEVKHSFVRGRDEFTIPTLISEKEFSLYTLLEKIPGLAVDGESVRIIGTGVPTYTINGLAPRPGEIAALEPEKIDKIVIDRMPSAKYGKNVVGIINIVTRKSLRDFLSVKLSDTFTHQNVPGNNGSVQINSKFGKWSNFVGYSNNYNRNKFETDYRTAIYHPEGTYQKNTFSQNDSRSLLHSLTFSPKYEINGKSFVDLQYTFSKSNSRSNNCSALDFVGRESNSSNQLSGDNADNHNFILRYLNRFKDNSQLTLNVGYSYKNTTGTSYIKEAVTEVDRAQSFLETILDSKYKSDVLTASADYEFALFDKIDMGVGANYALLKNNSRSYYRNSDTDYLTERKETQAAVYLNIGQGWDKFSYNLGLRGEFRYRHKAIDENENKHPYEFMPSIGLSYKINKDINLTLYASRTTYHPTISQLNPIKSYVNKYQYYVGNPDLRSMTDNDISFRISLPLHFSFDASYMYIKNKVDTEEIIDKDNPMITAVTEVNYDKLESATASLQWWGRYGFYSIMANVDYDYIFTRLPFQDNVNKRSKPRLSGRIQQTFSITKYINSIIGFEYHSSFDGVTSHIGEQYSLNVGVTFSLLKNRLRILVRGENLIYKDNYFTSAYKEILSHNINFAHSRRVRIGITYNFNNFRDLFKKNESNADILQRAL